MITTIGIIVFHVWLETALGESFCKIQDTNGLNNSFVLKELNGTNNDDDLIGDLLRQAANIKLGDQFHLKCAAGYLISKDMFECPISCEVNSMWDIQQCKLSAIYDHVMPKCVKGCPPHPLNETDNSTRTYDSSLINEVYAEGTNLKIECDEEFEFEDKRGQHKIVYECKNAEWKVKKGVQANCVNAAEKVAEMKAKVSSLENRVRSEQDEKEQVNKLSKLSVAVSFRFFDEIVAKELAKYSEETGHVNSAVIKMIHNERRIMLHAAADQAAIHEATLYMITKERRDSNMKLEPKYEHKVLNLIHEGYKKVHKTLNLIHSHKIETDPRNFYKSEPLPMPLACSKNESKEEYQRKDCEWKTVTNQLRERQDILRQILKSKLKELENTFK